MRNGDRLGDTGRAKGLLRLVNRLAHRLRANTEPGSRRNIAFHYDLGNDFYARLARSAHDLFERDLRRAALTRPNRWRRRRSARSGSCSTGSRSSPGSDLLEIGCGWGVAGRDRGARLWRRRSPALTLVDRAEGLCRGAARRGRPRRPSRDTSCTDYRDVAGSYDAVASVEMVEAVGQEYWPAYLDSDRARAEAGRAAPRSSSSRSATSCSTAMPPMPISSRPMSFPAAC